MTHSQCRLLIRAEGIPGGAIQRTYEADERLSVRDLSSRATVQVRVQEISPYRHVLLIDGRTYTILNVHKIQ
jgi:hypothetical protein